MIKIIYEMSNNSHKIKLMINDYQYLLLNDNILIMTVT